MDPRLSNLFERAGNLFPKQAILAGYHAALPRLLGLWRMLHAGLRSLTSRARAWLATNWPVFCERLRALVDRTGKGVIVLSRQARVHLGRLLAGLHHAMLLALHTTQDVARGTYGHIRRLVRHYWPPIRERLLLYVELTRLNRPIGILLLLWPTLWAVWVATAGRPSLHLLAVFTLGVILTRSAGCVLNDMADRRFDAQVRRTAMRPLATGRLTPREALAVACGLLLIAFMLVLTMNRLTVFLSFVAIPLVLIYPLMKRYTYVPQFFLGLAFSWGIPMAFAAATGDIPQVAWLLFIANILWSVVYDTIYAMVDREDDLKAGVKSTAILFDDADRVIIGILQLMFLTVMVLAGIQIDAKMLYYASLLPAAVLMIWHQYLIRHRQPDACFRAFLNNHWVGLTLLAGLYLNYL